jgi:hypothetical protein
MKFPFEILFIGISLGAALFIYKKNGLPFYLKAFSIFLLVTFVVEFSGWLLSSKRVNTNLLYNIFSTAEFIFLFWLLRDFIKSPIAKKILLYCILFYAPLVFMEIIFWMKPGGYHTKTYALACLLVVIFCIFYFYELFRSSHYIKLTSEPSFWICSGLLFFYTCSFPIFGLVNYLSQLPEIILKNITNIFVIINCLLYLLFTIAFLCRYKTQKFLS